jgi:rod shape-determining protein MreB
MEVKGRDSVAGLPKTLHVSSQEVREALMDSINSIVEVVRNALERCPPELAADLVDRGFVMAGGGSLIRNIDRLLSDATGLPVVVSDDPLSAVAKGTGVVLQNLAWLLRTKGA